MDVSGTFFASSCWTNWGKIRANGELCILSCKLNILAMRVLSFFYTNTVKWTIIWTWQKMRKSKIIYKEYSLHVRSNMIGIKKSENYCQNPPPPPRIWKEITPFLGAKHCTPLKLSYPCTSIKWYCKKCPFSVWKICTLFLAVKKHSTTLKIVRSPPSSIKCSKENITLSLSMHMQQKSTTLKHVK